MLLGPADLLDRSMRYREVNFPRGRARFRRREAETTEQTLRDAVVPLVLQ